MKKNIIFLLLGCIVLFTSCLKSGLDDIEDSDQCTISSLTMEYRWITQNANGYDQLSRQQMTLSNTAPDENNEIQSVLSNTLDPVLGIRNSLGKEVSHAQGQMH